MTARENAQKALRTHLRCDGSYAFSLLEVLNEDEIEQIAGQLGHPRAAVAIAAVIYRARLRLADEEASRHYRTILKTVPCDGHRITAEGPRTRAPGIRECIDPSPMIDP